MYDKKITDKSFNEFIKLTKLFNIHGLYPIIIGGWATYYYTKGAGSIDIDLILPSKQTIKILEKYCKQHGFKKHKTTKIRTLFKKEEIELDIFTLTNKNKLIADEKIEIPWKLSEKHNEKWELKKNSIARVPKREVLLLYKTAALIDRKYKIKNYANLPRITKDRLKSKIEKDKQDILGLLINVNKIKLEKYLEKTKFKKYYEKEINNLK